MKYPAKNPAKFLKPEPEPEPDIEAGYPAGSGFSRISGRFLFQILLSTLISINEYVSNSLAGQRPLRMPKRPF